MTIEEFDKVMENIPKIQTNNPISSMNSINVDELRKTGEIFKRIPTFDDLQKENNKLLKEKQELIDYLKDLIENRFTNSKVVWFDSEYARDFGELCSMAGAGDTRLALVPLSEIENILSKIEKR